MTRRMPDTLMKTLIAAMMAVFLTACTGVAQRPRGAIHVPSLVVISVNEPTIDPEHEAASFVIDVDTLFVTVEWSDIGEEAVSYRCEIYDGSGSLAFVMGGRLLSDEPLLYQNNYSPTSRTDAPGNWKVILYANDHMVAVKNIIGRLPHAHRIIATNHWPHPSLTIR